MSRFPEANKKLGQHFLHSPTVIKTIAGSLPPGCDCIVEVGPGPAVLTPTLKSHGVPLFVVEMDLRFKDKLSDLIGGENVHIQDALETDWEALLKDFKNVWLVSNLPYNVSVPLTLAFMKVPRIRHMSLMYQKEVAEKFLPRDVRNSMSSLAALAGIFFKCKRLCDVPPGAFQPPPKVMSQVLHFERLPESLVDLNRWDKLEEFLRLVFQNRRKQMKGVLKERFPVEKLVEVFRDLEIPETLRAEALELKQVVRLWENLEN